MPPPWATNPAPKTESARQAAASFYCALCQKGYSRVTEYEAHEGSYDHQHKKRLKDMKAMSKDPGAAARARRAEEMAGGGVVKKTGVGPAVDTPTAVRKGGFKKIGGTAATTTVVKPAEQKSDMGKTQLEQGHDKIVQHGDDDDDPLAAEGYDPSYPTACHAGCPAWGGKRVVPRAVS